MDKFQWEKVSAGMPTKHNLPKVYPMMEGRYSKSPVEEKKSKPTGKEGTETRSL